MKRFLTYGAKLLGITLLLMLLFDVLFSAVFYTASPRNKFQYILQMKPQTIEYVFLGSSRAANHIVPSEVKAITGKSAINMGIEGATLSDNLNQLRLMLDRNVTIKTLFVQVDDVYELHDVSKMANGMLLPYIHKPVVKTMLRDKIHNFVPVYYVPFYRYAVNGHLIGFREFVMTAVGKRSKVDLGDGFMPVESKSELKGNTLPEKVASRNEALDEIRQLCSRHNIELITFVAPYCSETKNLNYLETLQTKIPDLKNYSRAMPDSLFSNCGHLNPEGAEVFTRLLMKDYLEK